MRLPFSLKNKWKPDFNFLLTKISVIIGAINEPMLPIKVQTLMPLALTSVGNNSGAYTKRAC